MLPHCSYSVSKDRRLVNAAHRHQFALLPNAGFLTARQSRPCLHVLQAAQDFQAVASSSSGTVCWLCSNEPACSFCKIRNGTDWANRNSEVRISFPDTAAARWIKRRPRVVVLHVLFAPVRRYRYRVEWSEKVSSIRTRHYAWCMHALPPR